ncbi:MAG: hypothetical protein RIC35_15460 [Marinoscillum sp.]
MKLLAYLGIICLILGSFYGINHLGTSYTSQHPTLNETATDPDLYLRNVAYYSKEQTPDRCLYHLDKAITSIKYIESDMDVNTSNKVDEALTKLEMIYQEIAHNALSKEDLSEAFQYTLNTLALAELRVSERYAEGNHMDLSMIALKYAQLHIKNALQYTGQKNLKFEQEMFLQVDSILNNQTEPSVLVAEHIDELIREMSEKL